MSSSPEYPYLIRADAIKADELVYLMRGENLDHEVADFPRLGKRMIRLNGKIVV